MKYFILSISIYLTFFLFCCKWDELPESCYLEPDPGSCKASIPRFYFDQVEEKCKEFIYGACDGVVPFITLEECQDSCE